MLIILFIQDLVVNKKVDLVWSYVLKFENDQNYDNAKRAAIGEWRKRASILAPPDEQILSTASKIIKTGSKNLTHCMWQVQSMRNVIIS